MSFLKGINRSACTSWSPLRGDYLATATVVGTTDEHFDTSGHLELFRFDSNSSENVLSHSKKIELPDRVQSLAWGASDIIACGLPSGAIHFLDANQIINEENNKDAVVANVKQHNAPVSAVEFNKQQAHIMASGSEDSEVFIWNLTKPESPVAYAPGSTQVNKDPISNLSWNPQVAYILATVSQNGRVVVWDLRNKKAAVQFSSRKISSCRALSWNPTNPMQLITASDDDQNPIIEVWNIRHSQMPTNTLTGHQRGIWSTSWNQHDSKFLLSAGKENRAICWNIDEGCAVHQIELRSEWNAEIKWSPQIPAVFNVSSYDGHIGIYSLHDVSGSQKEDRPNNYSSPPSWLKRPAGASFGFGGKLITVDKTSVSINPTVTQPEILESAEKLKNILNMDDYLSYCIDRANSSNSSEDQEIWEFMHIQFDQNPKEILLTKLGFDQNQVSEAVSKLDTKLEPAEEQISSNEGSSLDTSAQDLSENQSESKKEDDLADLFQSSENDPFGSTGGDGADFFSFTPINGDDPFANLGESQSAFDSSILSTPEGQPGVSILDLANQFSEKMSFQQGVRDEEQLLAQCLILGNFSSAVEFCLKVGRLSDALMIAFCSNDTQLINHTRTAYFNLLPKNSFIRIIDHVSNKRLKELIAVASLEEWKCTLAILCSYASDDEFSSLCSDLGELLENNGYYHPALLCYICARNLDKIISLFEINLVNEDQEPVCALQNIIEKVIVLKKSCGEGSLSATLINKYCEYAELLASQGLLEDALNLISFLDNQQNAREGKSFELIDRLRKALAYSDDDFSFSSQAEGSTQFQESNEQPFSSYISSTDPSSFDQSFNQQNLSQTSVSASRPTQSQVSSPSTNSSKKQQAFSGPVQSTPFVNQVQPVQPVQSIPPVQSTPFGNQVQPVQSAQPVQSTPFANQVQPVQSTIPSRQSSFPLQNAFSPQPFQITQTPQPQLQSTFETPALEPLPASVVTPVNPITINPMNNISNNQPVQARQAEPPKPSQPPAGLDIIDLLNNAIQTHKNSFSGNPQILKTLGAMDTGRVQALKDKIESRGLDQETIDILRNFVLAFGQRDNDSISQYYNLLNQRYTKIGAKPMLGFKKLSTIQF